MVIGIIVTGIFIPSLFGSGRSAISGRDAAIKADREKRRAGRRPIIQRHPHTGETALMTLKQPIMVLISANTSRNYYRSCCDATYNLAV
jgi:hypothetical protein